MFRQNQGISAYELAEWQDYEAMFGPIGPERFDVLTGMTVQAVLLGAGVKDVTLAACMPQWGPARPRFDREADEAALAAISRADIPDWAKDEEPE